MLHHLIFIAAIVTAIAFILHVILNLVTGKTGTEGRLAVIYHSYNVAFYGFVVAVLLEIVFLIHHHRVDIYPRW